MVFVTDEFVVDWSSIEYCSWTGVECKYNDNEVIRYVDFLSLGNIVSTGKTEMKFIGYVSLLIFCFVSLGFLPTQIGLFVSISTIKLYSNNMYGTIPSEIGQLSTLRTLKLSDNSLSGTIPSEIGQLSSLAYLNLYDNRLSGTIPSELGLLSSISEMK